MTDIKRNCKKCMIFASSVCELGFETRPMTSSCASRHCCGMFLQTEESRRSLRSIKTALENLRCSILRTFEEGENDLTSYREQMNDLKSQHAKRLEQLHNAHDKITDALN